MSRAHAEIAHQTRRLGQLIDDITPGQPDDTDIADLRACSTGCMPSSGFTPPRKTRATSPWTTNPPQPAPEWAARGS
jgi:hypothetical protein